MNALEMPERYSEEGETGTLGAALQDPVRVVRLARQLGLTTASFWKPAHKQVWQAITTLVDTKGHADTLLVTDWLREQGWLDGVGGPQALDGLVDRTPTVAHAEHYLALVRARWTAREAQAALAEALSAAGSAESGEAVATDVVARMMALLQQRRRQRTNRELMDQSITEWEAAARGEAPAIGLPLPWDAMTELTCGLPVGLTLLAGATSSGKTTAESQIATWLAMQKMPVGRITLDMTHKRLLQRDLCRTAGVSLPMLKFGHAGKSGFRMEKLHDARDVLSEIPMLICDTAVDIADICGLARSWKLEHGIRLLTVDHVQLVQASALGHAQSDRVAKVSYVSAMLKALSLELEMPVLALSQLRRRDPKVKHWEPKLDDLRDSGCLEQDANLAMFFYIDFEKRAEMEKRKPGWTKKQRPIWGEVMKNQDGETGRIPYWMYPAYFRHEEIQGEEHVGGMFALTEAVDVELP